MARAPRWMAGGTLLATAIAGAAMAGDREAATQVALYDKGLTSYYVAGHIGGYGNTEFMVDTGSAYVAIGDHVVGRLADQGLAIYLRTESAVLANGGAVAIRVYRLAALRIGDHCELHDVEVAAVPGMQRQILGLSALKMAAPFTISVEPPSLALSGCAPAAAESGPRDDSKPTARNPLLARNAISERESAQR